MNVRPLPLVAALIAASVLLGACQGGGDEAKGTATTQAFMDQHDYKSAVISAKNVLQTNPQNGEVRRMLGQALLEGGEATAAALELRKARELGVSEASTLPLLAKALLAQGEPRQVIVQFAATHLDDAAASADLKTSVATAHALLGERENALEAVLLALKEWPQHAPASLLHARLLAGGGDMPGAMALLDNILASDARNVSALIYKGDLQRQHQRDDDKALATYREAVVAKPDSVAANAAVIALLLEQRDVPGAKAQFDKLKATAPNHPETRLFEAQLAYLDKDYTKTREITAQLLKVLPNSPLILQLAGGAELQLNSLAQAENFLTQAVKAAPRALPPRLLLAQLYLRSGQARRTLDTLQPMLESPNPDALSLSLAGQAYLQEGDAARSEAMFARAAKQDPKNTMARTALALNKLVKGNTDSGFADLEATAASDTGFRADFALIAARLRGNDLPGALKAIDALEKKQPDKPLAKVLRGNVQVRQKDLAGATTSFERALELDPRFYPATASLAALDMTAGRPAAAQQRFENLLKLDPKNYRAMLALADLKARAGGTKDEVSKLIADAAKANPSEPAPRLLLVKYLLSQDDTKAALAAAQDGAAAMPSNADVLEQLGGAQLANGQAQQAVTTFVKLTSMRPGQAEPELALADAHIAAKDYDAAKRSLDRALKLKPGLQAAQFGLGKVAVLQKRYDDAVKVARSLQASQPKQLVGYLLEADAENARGTPAAAVAPLRAALPLQDGNRAAIYLHRTFSVLNRGDEAERLTASWKKDHPRDVPFLFYLGDTAMSRSEFAQAELHYRSVIEVQPNNALAMNNIAWLMTRQQKPGAVAVAEKANELMPNRTPLMDTLAWALAHDNQLPRAIELQKKAIAAAPADASLKLTLAKIYIKSGDKPQARAELDSLAKLGPQFPRQAEVTELMKTL